MTGMVSSSFRILGKGIAAENIDFTSHDLEINLTELFPVTHGEITSRFDESEVEGETSTGESYAGKAKTTRTITARWLSNNGNRLTAPSIRRGETVLVWATADHESYRWTEDGDMADHRNTEVIVFGVRAAKDYSQKPNPKDSMYIFEINSERGLVSFHTSAARGEATTTALYWDLLSGIFSYEDGNKNKIVVDAINSMIHAKNNQGAGFGIIGDKGWFKAPSQLVLKSPTVFLDGNVIFSAPPTAPSYNLGGGSPGGVFDDSGASPPKR